MDEQTGYLFASTATPHDDDSADKSSSRGGGGYVRGEGRVAKSDSPPKLHFAVPVN